MQQASTTRQTRPFSCWLYLLIVCGLSWPFQFVSAIWARDLLSVYVFNAMSMVMVTVGTFVCGQYVFRDGFAGVGWSWGKPWHYVAVIGFALFLWTVPTLIDLAFDALRLPISVTSGQIAWVGVLLFVTLIPSFGEEFGWRGYLLPHLAQQMNARKAVLIHAMVWWAWHLPLVIGQTLVLSIALAKQTGKPMGLSVALVIGVQLLLSFVGGVLHGVIFAYIWMRGRSLVVSSVYHATYDGLRDSLALTVGLGPLTSWWSGLIIILVGVILLWRGKWNMLQTTTMPTTPSPEVLTVEV
jgi:membrane protease YdiL (CAAX protease family)